MNGRTIAAISTPVAVGGLGVIRISGEDAVTIADRVFHSVSGKQLKEQNGYTALYGRAFDQNGDIDEVVALVFKAPKSFTGEETVEFSCHGGVYIVEKLLRAILDAGASLAGPGEFTKRAFLNGKLSLTQAEGVMDLIASQSDMAAKAALNALDGNIQKSIKEIADKLIEIDGHICAWVDFPEEDLPELETSVLLQDLIVAKEKLFKLLNDFDKGAIIRHGIETAIIGRPNVGKSTLMNLLSGSSRSIVTDIPGTTRDVVEETVRLKNIVLRLADTAGLRETDDPVESVGVELSKKRLLTAGLILAVFDSSNPLDDYDYSLIDQIKDKPCVAIINKSDLDLQLDIDYIKERIPFVALLSAKTGTGKEELENAVLEALRLNNIDSSYSVFINERQRECVNKAVNYLTEAEDTMRMSNTLDAVSVMLDSAIDELLELTGEKASEAVVDNVFSKFCVGK